jgi:hypothetical protein
VVMEVVLAVMVLRPPRAMPLTACRLFQGQRFRVLSGLRGAET